MSSTTPPHSRVLVDVVRAAVAAIRLDRRIVGVVFVGGVLSAIPLLGSVLFGMASGVAVYLAHRTIRADRRPRLEFTTRLFSLFAAYVVASILVALGLILLVVPGVYVAVRLDLFFAAVMVDGHGPLRALSESWERTSGNSWTVFGLLLVLVVPTVTIFVGLVSVLSGGRPPEPIDTPTNRLLAGLVGVPFAAVHAGGIAVMYEIFEA